MPNLSVDEERRLTRRSKSILEKVKSELEVLIQERMRDGVTGRVNIEILTENGFIKKARVTEESQIEDEDT
jgi:hypothetical protein